MYAIMAAFLLVHIPQTLWTILYKLGLAEIVQRLQERLLAFFKAGYLS